LRSISLIATLVALAIIPATASAAPKKVFMRLSAASYTVVESGNQATITVLRSGNVRAAATVDYTTVDGTAAAPGDYTTTAGTLSFASNETRKSFNVPIVNNVTVGPASKKFTVKLSNMQAGTSPTQFKSPSTATVTILDDDGPGSIDFSSASYSVVEGAGVATITVTRASNPSLVESVDYATADVTATAGSDYTATTGTLTFNAGEMSKSFQIPITDDNVFEGDETLHVALSNPQNITTPLQPPILGPTADAGPATLTIVDDDVSTFSFGQPTYSAGEGDGTKTITVTRTGAISASADVGYSVDSGSPGSASGGGVDYTLTAGTLHFNAGETSKTFDVAITQDTAVEGNETIGLQLTEGTTQVATALLSIIDDDTTQPSVQFSNATYSGGESSGDITVTVTLDKPAAGTESVDYATSDTADPAHATAGSDYTATSGTIDFTAGQTSQTIDIPVTSDTDIEDNEDFRITLSGASGLQLGDPHQATVTILDDDSAGSLQFSALRYDVNENAGRATITVNRVGGSSGSASVDYATSDGTAGAPNDYTATQGTLTFADGETQKTFDIPVAWDGRQEADETVSINLLNFDSDDDPGAVKAAVLHIADDGASGPVQFDSPAYSVVENAGAATITVTRSGGSLGGPVTVDYAGSDGTSGTLKFAPGEASRSFQVPVVDDNVHTGPRTVNLSLGNPGGGTSLGSQATATLTIGDDDPVTSSSKDLTAPKLKLTVKKGQKVGKLRRLVIKVRSNEAAKLGITANLRKGKKLVRIAKASKRVGQNKTVTITLKLNKTSLAKLRAVLAAQGSKGRAKITIAVTGTDAAGNKRTIRKTVSVR
jgi:Calx-beta domain